MRIQDWLRHWELSDRKKIPDRYRRNQEHIRQVKKRKQREWRSRVKERIQRRKGMLILTGSMMALVVLVLGGIGVVRAMGRSHLYSRTQQKRPELQEYSMEEALTEEEETQWKEGWVKYKGSIYEYKKDILTFLVMGIDKNKDVERMEEGTDGGQADALFLVVVDPADRSFKLVGINRNTMTDIDIYDENGEFVTTARAQIAVQHGFGDGMEESCEYQKKAVENLFYGLPIHGYAAVNMKAIATINDAVGGVEVTVLEDLTKKDKSLIKDEKVHLTGESAFWYVQYRDTTVFGSADLRLARQKQYLHGFIDAAKKAAKENISVILELYQAVMPQMVTDVSLDEVAYLAPLLVDYRFEPEGFYTMEGETVEGEQFEEFHADETALYELILEVFYEKVE
mgnify:CR=1 FL=1